MYNGIKIHAHQHEFEKYFYSVKRRRFRRNNCGLCSIFLKKILRNDYEICTSNNILLKAISHRLLPNQYQTTKSFSRTLKPVWHHPKIRSIFEARNWFRLIQNIQDRLINPQLDYLEWNLGNLQAHNLITHNTNLTRQEFKENAPSKCSANLLSCEFWMLSNSFWQSVFVLNVHSNFKFTHSFLIYLLFILQNWQDLTNTF